MKVFPLKTPEDLRGVKYNEGGAVSKPRSGLHGESKQEAEMAAQKDSAALV